VEERRHRSFWNSNDKPFNEGRSYMKRFLGVLVVSMFLGSAAHAQETVPKSRAETEDRKVGFVGEQKTPSEK